MKPSKPSNLRVVTTPTFDWLAQKARGSRSRMLIASPYVNNGVIQLTNLVSRDVNRTLVTRTDLRDFALGSSNLETLCTLARDGVTVRSLSDLHAKVYIFDEAAALVTSANATYGGMHRNWECGLAITDTVVVRRLARLLLRGFGADRRTQLTTLEELEALRVPLEAIRVSLPERPRVLISADSSAAVDATFSVTHNEDLLAGFSGWLRLTLRGVLAMPRGGFRLEDLLSFCAPSAAREYPRNHHVPDKLRQQLQVLRNRGLVEFMNRGEYRCTIMVGRDLT